jgi:hypothetical protein
MHAAHLPRTASASMRLNLMARFTVQMPEHLALTTQFTPLDTVTWKIGMSPFGHRRPLINDVQDPPELFLGLGQDSDVICKQQGCHRPLQPGDEQFNAILWKTPSFHPLLDYWTWLISMITNPLFSLATKTQKP